MGFRHSLLQLPLFRLLAINLAAGIMVAALMLGGLLALNPHGLRDLILADSSPATAAGLLLFGFVITFGSTAMGTAIMTLGARSKGSGGAAREQASKDAALRVPVQANSRTRSR
jgi:hypothetical protein